MTVFASLMEAKNGNGDPLRCQRDTLVGEVSANFCEGRVSRGQRNGSPNDTLSPQKMALTSSKRGGHSVGIVRSRTKAMDLSR
jgi:hypothetical protein